MKGKPPPTADASPFKFIGTGVHDRLEPPFKFIGIRNHYRASGIGARQRNVLLSYDETRVGRTTRFAKILTMPCPLHEFIILRMQPISRRKYQEAPFAMRVAPIGGERRA